PEEVVFATKPELGRQILADLHAEGRLPAWVTGDEVYGADPKLRAWLEQVGTGYVLGIAKSAPIAFTRTAKGRADDALKTLMASDWMIDSAGAGSKGERRYAWAWLGTADPRRHLLIRRSLTPNAKGIREVAFYLCFAPEGQPVTLRTLVRVAGRRWPVEEDFQTGKDTFGLDHSQVRTYPALLRHLVLAMAALAVCAITAAHARTPAGRPPTPADPDEIPPADPGLLPLTVPEVKRLVNLLTHNRHAWNTTCAGICGDDATKPAPAGSTSEPDSADHDKITISDCRKYTLVEISTDSRRAPFSTWPSTTSALVAP